MKAPLLAAAEKSRLDPYLPYGLSLSQNAGAIERVQGEVKRMLLGGRLHPGQKVPMDELASNLEVSRTPVREALRLLEGEGLVQALPNRGFIVRRTTVEEIEKLYEARLCIESHTIAAAFERRASDFLNDVRMLQDIYIRILKKSRNRRLGMVADKAFHLRISQQACNPILVECQSKIFDTIIFTRVLEGFSLTRSDEAVAEHEAIIAALNGTNAKKAREAVAANIMRGKDAIVAYLREQDLAATAM